MRPLLSTGGLFGEVSSRVHLGARLGLGGLFPISLAQVPWDGPHSCLIPRLQGHFHLYFNLHLKHQTRPSTDTVPS